MSLINLGDQFVGYRFKHPATSSEFNKVFANVLPDGIYTGGVITNPFLDVVEIATHDAMMRTSTDELVRITTASAIQLSGIVVNDYICGNYTWYDTPSNYADYELKQTTDEFDVIFGKCIALNSGIPTISYTEKSVATLADVREVQYGTSRYGVDSEVTDDYEITLTPTLTRYVTGMFVNFIANNNNVGACTLNIDDLGAKPIYRNVNEELLDDIILADSVTTVVYDGTNFQMVSGKAYNPNYVTAGEAPSGALSYNGLTKSNGKLYGGTDTPNGSTRVNYDGNLHASAVFKGDTELVVLVGRDASVDALGYLKYNGHTKASGEFYGNTTVPDGSQRLNYSGHLHATAVFKGNDELLVLAGRDSSVDALGYLKYNGHTKTAGELYGDTTDPVASTRLNYDGYFYATRSYNAVYNDYADYWKARSEDETPIAGMCYTETGFGLRLAIGKRAEKGLIGICTDTYGHAVGSKKGAIPISVAGFVLACIDKPYPVGTLLTNGKNGKLTKARWYEIILGRVIAKYIRKEEKPKWNKILVLNRHWVKIV